MKIYEFINIIIVAYFVPFHMYVLVFILIVKHQCTVVKHKLIM